MGLSEGGEVADGPGDDIAVAVEVVFAFSCGAEHFGDVARNGGFFGKNGNGARGVGHRIPLVYRDGRGVLGEKAGRLDRPVAGCWLRVGDWLRDWGSLGVRRSSIEAAELKFSAGIAAAVAIWGLTALGAMAQERPNGLLKAKSWAFQLLNQ